MTKDVAAVGPDAPLRDVASLLTVREISGAPVVDESGRVLGVVSESDVLRVSGGVERARRGFRLRRRFGRRTAGAEMTAPPVTVTPGLSVAEAAALMLDRRVNRLPVVDGDRLVGIVTRADLVRAFVRSDTLIEREIRGDAVLRGIYVQPRDVEVSVRDGEVVLVGEVESRGKAERLVELVREVPGVVSVRSRVNWRVDKKAPKGIRPGRSR
jgi:CBS domain-containing protein